MAAASRELNVPQPALSHHMSELERIVGFPLLERLPRGVRVTLGGQALVGHARKILEGVAIAERDVRAFAAGGRRNEAIRLGMLPSWILNYGDLLMEMAQNRLPNYTLQLLEVRNDEAERMVNRNELDVATSLSSNPQFVEPIFEEPLFLASSDPLPASIRVGDLGGINLVLAQSTHRFRQDIERAVAEQGVSLRVALEVDGYLTLKRAVEQGIGSTVISWNSIRRECADGRLYAAPIVDPSLTRPVYLMRASGFDVELAGIIFSLLREITLTSGGGAGG